jgi:hypothetical protein
MNLAAAVHARKRSWKAILSSEYTTTRRSRIELTACMPKMKNAAVGTNVKADVKIKAVKCENIHVRDAMIK